MNECAYCHKFRGDGDVTLHRIPRLSYHRRQWERSLKMTFPFEDQVKELQGTLICSDYFIDEDFEVPRDKPSFSGLRRTRLRTVAVPFSALPMVSTNATYITIRPI